MRRWILLGAVIIIAGMILQACEWGKNEAPVDSIDKDIVNVFTSEIEDDEPEITAIDNSGMGQSLPEDQADTATPDNTAAAVGGKVTGDRVFEWGIVRNKNNQPPVPSAGMKTVLEKYNGKYIGDTSKKVIYLTFDEGYENGYTPSILDTLKNKNVKACFFITGPYLNKHADLVERMVNEGHTVGNHTVNHPSLPSVSNERVEKELIELDRVFSEKFGKNMKFLRPPKGEFSERTLEISNRLGYTNLMWSFAYDDWDVNKQRGAKYAYDIVINNLHNGAVLLLHAVSKDNTEALPGIIEGARQLGYEFGSVENLR